jgi:hypothetical protein
VVDSEIEAKTDEDGKFNCAVPLKFLYGSNYWLSVGNEDVKKSYEQVLQPGQVERSVEDSFEEGMAFRLVFTANRLS